jgi:hypothetical protein
MLEMPSDSETTGTSKHPQLHTKLLVQTAKESKTCTLLPRTTCRDGSCPPNESLVKMTRGASKE